MKVFLVLFSFAVLGLFAGCEGNPAGPTYPTSLLDGKPDAPNTLHSGHVCSVGGYGEQYKLDDGTMVKFYYTGGTRPNPDTYATVKRCGVLTVAVPSFETNDLDHTYYFYSFKEDKSNDQKVN